MNNGGGLLFYFMAWILIDLVPCCLSYTSMDGSSSCRHSVSVCPLEKRGGKKKKLTWRRRREIRRKRRRRKRKRGREASVSGDGMECSGGKGLTSAAGGYTQCLKPLADGLLIDQAGSQQHTGAKWQRWSMCHSIEQLTLSGDRPDYFIGRQIREWEIRFQSDIGTAVDFRALKGAKWSAERFKKALWCCYRETFFFPRLPLSSTPTAGHLWHCRRLTERDSIFHVFFIFKVCTDFGTKGFNSFDFVERNIFYCCIKRALLGQWQQMYPYRTLPHATGHATGQSPRHSSLMTSSAVAHENNTTRGCYLTFVTHPTSTTFILQVTHIIWLARFNLPQHPCQ